ncbi:hypothetical protein K0U00_25410 [Paenibacillus sepulcri]|uniref:Uncharacterized protein n=1 Tax=Paenibacillus sepulcri TaxID=359917 RepID=A0ABS7C8Y5_9BACL|nr:hypothetical protein [Paenibacillus sepulcri]
MIFGNIHSSNFFLKSSASLFPRNNMQTSPRSTYCGTGAGANFYAWNIVTGALFLLEKDRTADDDKQDEKYQDNAYSCAASSRYWAYYRTTITYAYAAYWITISV